MSKKKDYTAQFIGDVESYDKNKPFVVWNPQGYNGRLFEYSYDRAGTKDVELFRGNKLEVDPCPEHVIYSNVPEKTVKIFDTLPIGTYPIFNKRAISILEQICPNDFQAFPITVINSPKKKKLEPFENHDYFIINITNTVDAIDKDNSTLEYLTDGVTPYGVRKLALKPNAMLQHDLSRDGFLHSQKLVSYNLAIEFIKQEITGISFKLDIKCGLSS
ncbi:MAG: hypothetical protein COB50_05130 [Thiotrichales bacterium]|nr:MAG: hypothetical protein COB50_05130 [Thiotrichales bacterium]